VHLRGEVGEEVRGTIAETAEDLDPAALLGDEDAAVSRELDRRRVRQAREDGGFLESRRQRTRARPAEREKSDKSRQNE
jgi:hypothetical protein